jgi:hypothetical protein
MLQVSNIAWDLKRELTLDTTTGHIKDAEAMKQWGREYQPGWEVKV